MSDTAPNTSPAKPTRRLTLASSVKHVPGVGDATARRLGRLSIHTISDLIRHLPLRYEKHFAEGNISDLPMTGVGTAKGTIVKARWVPGGRGRGRFEATLQDHSGTLSLTWFNASYLRQRIHAGSVIRVQGKVKAFNGYAQMANPKWEAVRDQPATDLPERDEQLGGAGAGEQGGDTPPPADGGNEDRLRPVYPATEDLSSEAIERLIAKALPEVAALLKDPLPAEMVTAHAMPVLAEAYRWVHQPADQDQVGAARRRLAFNELLLLQLGISLKRHYNANALQAPELHCSDAIDTHIRDRFPFPLTGAQDRVVREIAADLQRTQPMNRLVQGDVGAGKTIVALYGLLMAVANRCQGALMAPTELLAEQHFLSITSTLSGSGVRVELLTGGRAGSRSRERRELLERIEAGEVDIVVGTQALLTETVRFHRLALVVIDEQHRFGVVQRAAFRGKAGGADVATDDGAPDGATGSEESAEAADRESSPHYLVMTATPIPRTLSLTVFGDLDVSTIDELPPGRTPIATRVVGEQKIDDVYGYVGERVANGEQAYVVVPAIEGKGQADSSGDDGETDAVLKNVEDHVKKLRELYGSDRVVEGIHGRLKPDQREAIMSRFRGGQVDVLVATTVIEVGVDVPNATLMVVEHAERFGLAQLHQLRGRIGRGDHGRKSVCVFIANPTTEDAEQRMEAIGATTDGFKIAERDLAIRGMGDFFGTRQHGLPPLRVARIPEDMDLLQLAKRDADAMVAADPRLEEDAHVPLRKILLRQYGEALGLIDVG